MLYCSVTGCCYKSEALVEFRQNGEQLNGVNALFDRTNRVLEVTMYRDFEGVIRSAMAN